VSTAAGTTSQEGTTPPVLELRGATARFGSVAALSAVNLALRGGEVTCLLGENGSGKSTLVAVLSGMQRLTDGELLLDGRPARFRSPRQARAAGIATVWQDLAIAPLMSVWRNFFLGAEPTRGPWPFRRLDVARAQQVTATAMAGVGVVGLDPDQPASGLQAGERQSLAIARALHFGARALVLDEPTAPMTVAQRAAVRPPGGRPVRADGRRPGGRRPDRRGRRRARPHPAGRRRRRAVPADRRAAHRAPGPLIGPSPRREGPIVSW
jgi:simple sugar transport system ATP-binding protein